MLAVAVHAYVMPYAELSSKLMGKIQMRYFANAGVERAIFEVENDDTELYDSLRDSWSSQDAAFKDVTINGGTFSAVKDGTRAGEKPQYGLTDEEGKINLNKAPQQVLKSLFEKIALAEPDEADAIADSIIDWRDEDDIAHKSGKENDYYQSLERPYDCKNSDFEVPEELRWVAGVTPEMFDKIKDHITVHGEGAVNVNTAGIPVLVSLGMDEELAEKVVRFRTVPGSKKEGEILQGIFTDVASIADLLSKTESLSGDDIAQIQRAVPQLGVRSDNFKGHILGSYVREGRTEEIVFVYDRKEHLLKSWSEG
jgi:general secretion pathway protein K